MPFVVPKDRLWPSHVRLRIYDMSMVLLAESQDSNCDLSGDLWWLLDNTPTFYLGVTIEGEGWPVWDEKTLMCIEENFKCDLEFDRYRADISRDTPRAGEACTEEFVWKIHLRYF